MHTTSAYLDLQAAQTHEPSAAHTVCFYVLRNSFRLFGGPGTRLGIPNVGHESKNQPSASNQTGVSASHEDPPFTPAANT